MAPTNPEEWVIKRCPTCLISIIYAGHSWTKFIPFKTAPSHTHWYCKRCGHRFGCKGCRVGD